MFIVVVIVSLATILVLCNNEDNSSNIDTTTSEKPSNENGNEENNSAQTEIYAESFVVTLPIKINILLNTKVRLMEGYIAVHPVAMKSKLITEIATANLGPTDGLKFENNEFIATKVGKYKLKFKMPKTANTYFTHTIDIDVYEDVELAHIYQIKNSLIVGENVEITKLFNIRNNYPSELNCDSKIQYNNKQIEAKTVGESFVEFIFKEDFIAYTYNFKINIKEIPLYRIDFNGLEDTGISVNLNTGTYSIIYDILNSNEEKVDQEIEVISKNENIVTIERVVNPFIKLKLIGVGETEIVVSLVSDPYTKVEIKIIIN